MASESTQNLTLHGPCLVFLLLGLQWPGWLPLPLHFSCLYVYSLGQKHRGPAVWCGYGSCCSSLITWNVAEPVRHLGGCPAGTGFASLSFQRGQGSGHGVEHLLFSFRSSRHGEVGPSPSASVIPSHHLCFILSFLYRVCHLFYNSGGMC